jgi:hypothetical protein
MFVYDPFVINQQFPCFNIHSLPPGIATKIRRDAAGGGWNQWDQRVSPAA